MKKSSLILALALALSAGRVMAQPSDDQSGGGGQDGPPPGQSQHHGRHRPALPLLKALDTNGDGIIDATEIANAPANLKKLDKNGDGKLTKDEYLPVGPDGKVMGPPPGPDGETPPPPPLVAALDVNGDGVIDATEIANASAELLKLDKNGDGKLTADEYRPHRPRGGGGPDGGQGPGQDGAGRGHGQGQGQGPDDGNGPPNGGPPKDAPPNQ